MFKKYNTILLCILFIFLTSFIWTQSGTIENGLVFSTASKRCFRFRISGISVSRFIKKLPKNYSASEIYILTNDPLQDLVVHVRDNDLALGKQKFKIFCQSYYQDIYLYAFMYNGKKLKRLFPNSTEFCGKNPIIEHVAYATGSDLGFEESWNHYSKSKGRNTIYVFLSKKPIRSLKKVKSVSKLDKIYKRYVNNKHYKAIITNSAYTNRWDILNRPYIIGFKKVYALKLNVKIE